MNRILNKLVPFIALAGGILFIVLGFINVNKQKTYTETTAVITRIEVDEAASGIDEDGNYKTEYDVFVKYTVDGKEYEAELGEYSASMDAGENVAIRYNPENPEDIVKSGNTSTVMLFAFGGLAVVTGAVLVLKKFR